MWRRILDEKKIGKDIRNLKINSVASEAKVGKKTK